MGSHAFDGPTLLNLRFSLKDNLQGPRLSSKSEASRGWERFIPHEAETKRTEVHFLKGVRHKSYVKLRNTAHYGAREDARVAGISCVLKLVFEKVNLNRFIGGW